MELDVFTNKRVWSAICSVALIGGLYRIYFTNAAPASVQAIIDKNAIDDFSMCTIVKLYPSYMKYCDAFYLDYLPKKTGPKYKQKIYEIPKLNPSLIVSTYLEVLNLRSEYGLQEYPELRYLSNGQLASENT